MAAGQPYSLHLQLSFYPIGWCPLGLPVITETQPYTCESPHHIVKQA